jgi:transposase
LGRWYQAAPKRVLRQVDVEIVKRSDKTKGLKLLPRRWIVECSIARLNHCHRLAKDWENLNHTALAFMQLASVRLMLRKRCNPWI